MAEAFDAVIVGAGPGGGGAAVELAAGGMKVALCEAELLGGECPFWACMPSKALLRPPEARSEARRAAGIGEPSQDFAAIAAHRDRVIHHLDDTRKAKGYDKRGIPVYRGEATIAGGRRVEVAGETLEAERIVIATGSRPSIPPIEGLAEAGYWTNREAVTVESVPESIVILGGGPVGVELGQALRRFGAEVTLVEAADRLMSREDPRIGELTADLLAEDGIEVRVDARATAVSQDRGGRRMVALEDGSELSAQELLVATGRSPRTDGIGLERLGVEVGDGGEVLVDERLRAGDRVWAVGDVTGIMPFTHVGAYQARVAAADMLGEEVDADYRGVPRVIFSDPEIAAVGLSAERAREEGIDVETVRLALADELARPITYEEAPRRQELELVADRDRGVLVGAWAVAPLAGEWIHQAAMAIKLRAPVEDLRDTVSQFPTYCEGFTEGVREFGWEVREASRR